MCKQLIVGGACQGKLEYALRTLSLRRETVADGGTQPIDEVLSAPVLDRLHLLVRRLLEAGDDPTKVVLSAFARREDWVVLCDEIGAGVTPIEKSDRIWREETGRLCCALAQRAERVERVVCGLPQVLKSGEALE